MEETPPIKKEESPIIMEMSSSILTKWREKMAKESPHRIPYETLIRGKDKQ